MAPPPQSDDGTVDPSFLLNDQDRVLFGTLTFSVTDRLAESIDRAITKGVATLPMLRQDEAASDDSLTKTLRKTFGRNVDIFERYLRSNIFTVQACAPTRRRRVVEAFLEQQQQQQRVRNDGDGSERDGNEDVTMSTDNDENGDDNNNNSNNNNKHDNNNDDIVLKDVTNNSDGSKTSDMVGTRPTIIPYKYPSKEEITALLDNNGLGNAEQDLIELRQKLRSATLRRTELRGKLERLARLGQTATKARGSIDAVSSLTQRLHESVQTAVRGQNALGDLQEEAKEMSMTLDENKRERTENKENDDGLEDEETIVAVKKPKPTLEEAFVQHKEGLQASATDFEAWNAML